MKKSKPPAPAIIERRLTVAQRLNLLQLLPERGGLTTMRTVSRLRDRLALDNREEKISHELAGTCKHCGRGGEISISALSERIPERVFGFSGLEVEVIAGALRGLAEKNQLAIWHVPLWDMFIGEGDTDGSMGRS